MGLKTLVPYRHRLRAWTALAVAAADENPSVVLLLAAVVVEDPVEAAV